jgi:hypothetical protein
MGGEAPVTPVLSLDSSCLNPSYKPCDNMMDAILSKPFIAFILSFLYYFFFLFISRSN